MSEAEDELRRENARLRAELERLRAGQASATAAGGGAVETGSVRFRDVIGSVIQIGVGNQVVEVPFDGHRFTGQASGDAGQDLVTYLALRAYRTRYLPLRALDPRAGDAGAESAMELAKVYIALDTTARRPVEAKARRGKPAGPGDAEWLLRGEETPPIGVLEAVAASRCVVLLGDPGSGKSTFVNHLVHALASRRLPEGWPAAKQSGARHLPVPVPVILRDFAQKPPGGRGTAKHLTDFLQQWLADECLGFVWPELERSLGDGRAVVLLDGLDELASSEARRFTAEAVTAFAERYPRARIVVTCRVLSYQDAALQLRGFEAYTVAPLTTAQIDTFIGAWYEELARLGRAQPGESSRLRHAVTRADLLALARNPLLLTVMAQLDASDGKLPDARALLYERTIELLLMKWDDTRLTEAGCGERVSVLLDEAGARSSDLLAALSKLAYAAQERGGSGKDTADIDGYSLLTALSGIHPTKPARSLDWATRLVEIIKLRAGLLIERAPGRFAFPHRTFQEYLAGAHLASEPMSFASKVAQLDPVQFREPILLAAGRFAHIARSMDVVILAAGRLCPERLVDDEVSWRRAWLAGELVAEVGAARFEADELGTRTRAVVRRRLVELLERSSLKAVERAKAGDALGRIGDPRFSEEPWGLPGDGALGFVAVPAGTFVMGSDKQQDPEAYGDEAPAHRVDLPRYFLGRYPVTVGQFRRFVASRPGSVEGERRWEHWPANRPVVDVTWIEAMAYCEWLTEELQRSNATPEPLRSLIRCGGGRGPRYRVVLPSEPEWERAARGTDGRVYPWNGPLDNEHANYGKTGIGQPSPVGCFPLGRGPVGCEDLSGNVWEWTRSKLEDYPYVHDDGRERFDGPSDESPRVVRGGAFDHVPGNLRAAIRYHNHPGVRNIHVGFRVAVSPFPSDL